MRYPHSFAYDLDLILDGLPGALVPAGIRDDFRRLASRLPSLDGGLEIRLGHGAAPVDLSVCGGPEVASSLAALAGADPDAAIDPALLAHPAWAAVPGLAAAILARAPPYQAGAFTKLWLEFDRTACAEATPVPCVMVTRQVAPGQPVLEELRRSYAAVTGAAPHQGLLQAAEAAMAGLQGRAQVISIGALAGRAGSPARLRLDATPGTARRPGESLAEALAAPWGNTLVGAMRHAAGIVARITPVESATLDLYADRAPRIGLPIACLVLPRATPAASPALEAALAVLEAERLCRPDAAAALRAWPGWIHDPRPVDAYPHRRRQSAGALLLRAIAQLKLSFTAKGTLEAKAYIGALRRSR